MPFPLELKTFCLHGQSFELFVPEPEAVRKTYLQGGTGFPYWSQVWPAAQGLGAFLLQHRQYIQNKHVAELAAGLGLPSLVAARYARTVRCSDYVAEAVHVVHRSAAHHRLHNFSAERLDWRALPQTLDVDVLLLSDINYEPEAFALQWELVHRFLQKGTTVILSTPQRLMAREFITPLLLWCRHQTEIVVPHTGKEVPISVLVLQQD